MLHANNAKMLKSTDETYNNKQVSEVLSKISAETCLKMDYFGSKFQKSPSTRGSAPNLPFKFND